MVDVPVRWYELGQGCGCPDGTGMRSIVEAELRPERPLFLSACGSQVSPLMFRGPNRATELVYVPQNDKHREGL